MDQHTESGWKHDPQPDREKCEMNFRNNLTTFSWQPRKNLGCLLKAWDRAAFKDWKLVIVGDRAGIFESVSLKTDSPQVLFTGRLENRELLSSIVQVMLSFRPRCMKALVCRLLKQWLAAAHV
jgi:hypothetical protein